MSSASWHDSPRRIVLAPNDLRVRDWPLRDDGWRAWAGVVTIGAIATGMGWRFHNVAVGAASGVALLAAGWRLVVPVTWEFNGQGVTERVLGRRRAIPWTSVAGWKCYRRGVLLLPDANPAPWSAWHAWYVPWCGEREQLVAILEHYVGASITN